MELASMKSRKVKLVLRKHRRVQVRRSSPLSQRLLVADLVRISGLDNYVRDRDWLEVDNIRLYDLVSRLFSTVIKQLRSDRTMLDIGLSSLVYVPQLFYLRTNDALRLVLVKVTDDIFIAGEEDLKRRFIERLSSVYELGALTHLRGVCWFYGLLVCQDEEYKIQVHADAKLSKLTPY